MIDSGLLFREPQNFWFAASRVQANTILKTVRITRFLIQLQNCAAVWGGGSERILHGLFPIQLLH